MRLSIIVPVYNSEKYLEQCLNSICTIKLEKEIILINDGSQDKSLIIMEKYYKLYPNLIKIITQKNQGAATARNKGLNTAKGRIVAFIDSDDFIKEDEFIKLIEKIEENNLDIGVGNLYFTEPFRKNNCKIPKGFEETGIRFIEEAVKNKSYRSESCINIYRREFLTSNNISFEDGLLYEDALFIMKAFLYARKVGYYDNTFYTYRQHKESISHTEVTEKNYQSVLFILDEILETFEEQKIDSVYWNSIFIGWYYKYSKRWKIKNEYLKKKVLKLKVRKIKDVSRKIRIKFEDFNYSSVKLNKKR